MESFQSKCQESKFGINFKQKAKKSKVISYTVIRLLKAASWDRKKKKKKKKKIYHAYLSKESISTTVSQFGSNVLRNDKQPVQNYHFMFV